MIPCSLFGIHGVYFIGRGVVVCACVENGIDVEAFGQFGQFGRITDGNGEQWHYTLREPEQVGNHGCIIGGGAEVAGPESGQLSESDKLLGKYGCVHYSPGVALEIVEPWLCSRQFTPCVVSSEVEAKSQHRLGSCDGRLGEMGGSQRANFVGGGGEYRAVKLHVAGIGGVGSLGDERADE